MKILQMNSAYEYSSTGRTTEELHEELLSRGVKSYVAACNVNDGGTFIRFSNLFSEKIHAFMSRLTGRQGIFSFFTTKVLINKIDKIKPDVVHLRVLHSNCLNFPMLLKYLAKKDIAVVLTLHDCWYFTGHCCYFTESGCERWKEHCGKCPELQKWNKSWFIDSSRISLAQKKKYFNAIPRLAVIGVSDWVTAFLKDSILKDALVIRRIYNWIDLSKFTPDKAVEIRNRYQLQDKFVVLCVAQNWNQQKGIYDIIEVAKRRPGYYFMIVGNIPSVYKPLPTNMISVGVASSTEDLAKMNASADVFFNPSYRETFGKVTVEALASGTPVIGYNLTATPELISEGCGYICEPKDFDSVIKCLDEVHDKGKEYYIENCVQFVKTNFEKKRLIDDYVSLYEEMYRSKAL